MTWLQAHMGSFTTMFASFLSLFGEELVMVLVMALYWCINKRLGVAVGVNLCFATCATSMIKNVVLRRRPYFDNESISCLKPVDSSADIYDIAAQGYSFPSGHSSSSATAYGTIAYVIRKKWVTISMVILALLVGCSRFCLGVHYPTDVLCGWLLGTAVVFLLPLVQSKLGSKPLFYLVLILISAIGCFYCSTDDYFTSLGLLIGFTTGTLFEERYIGFEDVRKPLPFILRLVVGLIIYEGLSVVLKLPFSSEFLASGTALAHAVRVIRYTIVIFVVVGLYPICFKKFKIFK